MQLRGNLLVMEMVCMLRLQQMLLLLLLLHFQLKFLSQFRIADRCLRHMEEMAGAFA